MIPIATKVCLFSDKTNFRWKIIRPVESIYSELFVLQSAGRKNY